MKYLFLYYFYNFLKSFLVIPEQSLLFEKVAQQYNNSDLIHETVSSVLSNILILNNIIYSISGLLIFNILRENNNNLMLLYGFVSKLLLISFCFLFYFFKLDSKIYNFINVFPAIIGDDVFFFTSYNNLISRRENKNDEEKTLFFTYSLAAGLSGKFMAFYLSNFFFVLIDKSYFIFYITCFTTTFLTLISYIFFLEVKEIKVLHLELFRFALLKEFIPCLKEALKKKTIIILLILNVLQPPFSIVEMLIFLETRYKFHWTDEKISVYKSVETAFSILSLIFIFPKLLNVKKLTKKNILLLDELIILSLFSLMIFEIEYLYFIIGLFIVFQLFFNVLIKSVFASLGKDGIYFILYNLSYTLSIGFNMTVYSLFYSKSFSTNRHFLLLSFSEIITFITTLICF